jgi:hypothetical protein
MAFTPLHRALGLEPSTLTASMLKGAIDQQITEKTDLDWKEKLPESRNPRAPEEFAKDVAAMVNAGGGMIVFGMTENRETSSAERLVPLDAWTDGIERKLRGWAYSLIQPPVHGLEFIPLTNEEGQTAVALIIPSSLETPHFAMKDDALRAPRRYGAQTVFMSERDIEQAYRKRFNDRLSANRSLDDLQQRVMSGAVQRESVWLSAVARPTSPRPAYAGRVKQTDAQQILASLMTRNPFLVQRQGLEKASLNPRSGYRSWRATDAFQGRVEGIIDLHYDGSVGIAFEASNILDGDFSRSSDVHVMEAQSLSAHIIHLIQVTAQMLEVSGDYEISLTFSPPGENPMFIRTFEPVVNFMRSRDQLEPIHQFQRVRGILSAGASYEEALESVHELALDIMNQGGATALGTMYLKPQTQTTER